MRASTLSSAVASKVRVPFKVAPAKVGVVKIVEEAKTSGPVPISFETEDNNSAEVIDEAAVP